MRKTKISLLLLASLAMGLNFVSCNKDEFTEEDAINMNHDLSTQDNRVCYTVSLVDASKSTLKGATAADLSGAAVTITQGDVTASKTADASGVVVFENLKPGSATLTISLTDYSKVSAVVNFGTSSSADGGIQFGNIIPLIPIAGTATAVLKGSVTYEGDLTDKDVENVPDGTKVIATVQTNSGAIDNVVSGAITKISYDNLSLVATVTGGQYSMTVPATALGLTYSLRVEDFTANQSLLQATVNKANVFGVQSIPTVFGSSITSMSTVPTVSAVYATIAAPSFTSTEATATAVYQNDNALESLVLTGNGVGYTNGTYSIVIEDANVTEDANKAAATVIVANNVVSKVEISAGGKGYTAKAYTIDVVQEVAEITVNTVSATGAIETFSVTESGKYLTNNEDLLTFTGGAGTTATFNLGFSKATNSYYYVSGMSTAIDNAGKNYKVNDVIKVVLKTGTTTGYTAATGNLTLAGGKVIAAKITNPGSNYISGEAIVTFEGGNGKDAAGTALIDDNGQVYAINMTNYGTGYSAAPTIKIINKVAPSVAKATVTVSTDGKVTGVSLVDGGNGYLTAPVVTLTPHVAGIGTGATAIATVAGGKVTSITVTNPGSDYLGVNYNGGSTNVAPSADVKSTGTAIRNIHLGQGKRSIEQ